MFSMPSVNEYNDDDDDDVGVVGCAQPNHLLSYARIWQSPSPMGVSELDHGDEDTLDQDSDDHYHCDNLCIVGLTCGVMKEAREQFHVRVGDTACMYRASMYECSKVCWRAIRRRRNVILPSLQLYNSTTSDKGVNERSIAIVAMTMILVTTSRDRKTRK